MNASPVPFADLIAETRDGEWGEGQETPGYQLCGVIRGTDFEKLSAPDLQLPSRWIADHLVARKALQAGDILIETAGGTATQSTGRTALITKQLVEAYEGTPLLCSSFARYLRVHGGKVQPQYLYYVLRALYRAGYMAVFNLQHTGVSRFQFTSFKNKTSLVIPPPAVQKNIAAILSTYDDLISNNQRRIALLETMAEEIYREWFVRMRFPGAGSQPFAKGRPTTWLPEKLGDICCIVKGKSYAADDLTDDDQAMPFITLKSFERGGGYRAEGLKFYKGEHKQEQVVRRGDIVMAVTDMTQERAVVGQAARIPRVGENGAVISLDVMKLVPDRIEATFLYLFLRYSGFSNCIREFANGANVLHLKPDLVGQQVVALPPLCLQSRLCDVVEPMLEEAEKLMELCTLLRRTRDALLPRLISGKLKVDHLHIRMPPGMLAESVA